MTFVGFLNLKDLSSGRVKLAKNFLFCYENPLILIKILLLFGLKAI